MEALCGEYRAELLAQRVGINTLARGAVQLEGWAFKAFLPGGTHGDGYNGFLRRGRVRRRCRMRTFIGPSMWDGRMAFVLDYRPYRSIFGAVGMVDEIRVVGQGVMLGLGHMLKVTGRRPLPFALIGPPTAWVGPDRDEV